MSRYEGRTIGGRLVGLKPLAGTLALAAVFSAAAMPAAAAEWSDTYLGWRYGTKFAEPSNPNDISKNILSLTHASGYKYGVNFFNVDMLISDSKDPAANGSTGAQEVYVVYRNTFDLGKITGKDFKSGVVRGLGVTAGFDFNAKDDAFGARKRMPVLGPTVMFDVPGFLNVSLLFAKEWDHTSLNFSPTIQHDIAFKTNNILDIAWGIPFMAGSIPAKFQGYFDYATPKGKDYFGNDTAAETHTDMSVMFDVGAAMGSTKDTFWLGLEYEYWKNKFGNQPGTGTLAKTPMIRVEYHF